MCGRFRVTDSIYVQALLEHLGVAGQAVRFTPDAAPGSQISIVRQVDGQRRIDDATWWLFLDPGTLKPNYKYASFNSRWDKLNAPRSLAYHPYRKSRCIIPATAICEGLGDKKTYHQIELENRAIAFGGLYKEHVNRETGEIVRSASIITLPPVAKWEKIHPKSIPLMLDWTDGALMDKWLDPDFQDVDAFSGLLESALPHPQIVTPIDRPSKWNPVGESFVIS